MVLRRRYEAERELRLSLNAKGELPATWIVEAIRSGEWERRQKRNMQALLHDRAKLSRWKRAGYTFDEQHRLVAPALTRIHVPERRESVSRPRERRAGRAGRAGASRPSSGSSEPPLAPRRRLTAVERRVLKLLIDARRREIIAAGIQLTEADRALFADDVAEQQSVR
jgi:hypothetical protein